MKELGISNQPIVSNRGPQPARSAGSINPRYSLLLTFSAKFADNLVPGAPPQFRRRPAGTWLGGIDLRDFCDRGIGMLRFMEPGKCRWTFMTMLGWMLTAWPAGAMGQEGSPSVPVITDPPRAVTPSSDALQELLDRLR